jgi:hypothetical protein
MRAARPAAKSEAYTIAFMPSAHFYRDLSALREDYIALKLRANDEGVWSEYQVRFEGVTSFYYVAAPNPAEVPCRYLELSEIYYYEEDLHRIGNQYLGTRPFPVRVISILGEADERYRE